MLEKLERPLTRYSRISLDLLPLFDTTLPHPKNF